MTIACASKMMMILILLVLVSKFIDQDKMVNEVPKYSDVLGMAKTMIKIAIYCPQCSGTLRQQYARVC